MIALAETLENVNPHIMLWLHTCQSRASATGWAAIDGMTDEEKLLIHNKMLWLGIGPAEP